MVAPPGPTGDRYRAAVTDTDATPPVQRAAAFMALHRPGDPLLLPNAWDEGSARLLEALGFEALATTSSGFAATLGRLDGEVGRDEALAHGARLAAAVAIPVTADTEDGFGPDPATVADTVRRAGDGGLAGCSVEDFTRRTDEPIYDRALAVERIAAAAEAAHGGPRPMVLTARAENLIRGRPDLDDTIARLQAYQEAGADVLFAPGLRTLDDVTAVVSSLDRPLSVLALDGCPSVPELAAAGVGRVSVGGAFAFAAYARLVEVATELRRHGTYGWWPDVARVRVTLREAFATGAGSRYDRRP